MASEDGRSRDPAQPRATRDSAKRRATGRELARWRATRRDRAAQRRATRLGLARWRATRRDRAAQR
ncbi:MAG: hypothetical protein QOJ35_833, partial [Solirubrobacteraceae bacterium]|nr:hypothetical protein [Solirubrobacteraceae bacterium]